MPHFTLVHSLVRIFTMRFVILTRFDLCEHILLVLQTILNLLSQLHIRSNFFYYLTDIDRIPINNIPPSKPSNEDYNSDELDLLALFCTLVKILYVVGCLEFISSLIALISTHPLFVCFCHCHCLMAVEYFDSNGAR
jgi:hypothetical protein